LRETTRRTRKEVLLAVDPHSPRSSAGRDSIRVLVADGDGLARGALRDALSAAGLTVVGQAADSEQAVSLATRCRPDVVLLDSAVPPEGALATMRALAPLVPKTRIIVLAPPGDDTAALLAVAEGAAGYLSREIDLVALARAVEGVMADEAAISRATAWRLMAHVRQLAAGLIGMRPVKSELTTREWEVVDFLKAGASTTEIARTLVLSPDTVHSHVQNILRKLNAHSRAEAVEIAERSRAGLPELV
jgi:DNA-binding NarL/FixJ family response regulator